MDAIPVEILAKDVACTLRGSEVPERAAAWKALLARATTRVHANGVVTFRFPAMPGMAAAVAELAEAEIGCCSFFGFTIRIEGGEVTLEARAPDDAAPLLEALFVL